MGRSLDCSAAAVSRVLRRLAPSEWWAKFRTQAAQGIDGAQDACSCGRNTAHTREVCASYRASAYRRHLQHLLEYAGATIPEAIIIAYDGVCDALLAGQPLDQAATAHLPAPQALRLARGSAPASPAGRCPWMPMRACRSLLLRLPPGPRVMPEFFP
jgi:hypothetical protein